MLLIKVKISKAANASAFGVSVGDIVELKLNQYLRGVVASEIGNAPLEACKAQAVASRTTAYPYYSTGKVISDSSSTVQSFNAERMTSLKYPVAHQAVDDTDGQVLMCEGKVISPCSFSASNGGKTTSSQSRWGGYRSWLIEQEDPWDYAATNGKKTGHGVGLSQEGAKYAAKTGCSFEDILSFYYPNTILSSMKGADDSMATTVKASYQIEKFKYMVEKKWKYVANAASEGAVDCSGAFTYWYAKAGGYMYHGSNTMWRKYSTSSGKIGSISLVPGMAVYKHRFDGKEPDQYKNDGIGNFYHVGLYVGDGKVVEAKGTNYGVVYSSINEWTHASKLKNTDYDVGENSSASLSFPSKGKVVTQGGRLNIRKTPVNGAVLTLVPNETILTVTGMSGTWYQVQYNGFEGYVSPDYIQIISETVGWNISCNTTDKGTADQIAAFIRSCGCEPIVTER